MAGNAALPDWRDPLGYDWLLSADRGCFAWEWLRRNGDYRRDWERADGIGSSWLVRCEDPALDARSALPLWRSDCDPGVLLGARVEGDDADVLADAAFDFRVFGPMLRMVASGRVEHVRIGGPSWCVRIDLEGGGIATGPIVIGWRLAGILSLPAGLASLRRLHAMCRAGAMVAGEPAARAPRWILALRTHDALRAGATHRDIARDMFGALVPPGNWRVEAPSIRLRVQRLAQAARVMVALPPTVWFR